MPIHSTTRPTTQTMLLALVVAATVFAAFATLGGVREGSTYPAGWGRPQGLRASLSDNGRLCRRIQESERGDRSEQVNSQFHDSYKCGWLARRCTDYGLGPSSAGGVVGPPSGGTVETGEPWSAGSGGVVSPPNDGTAEAGGSWAHESGGAVAPPNGGGEISNPDP